jgi:hypothetical protein
MDVLLLLSAYALGMCLPSRRLVMGIHVTIFWCGFIKYSIIYKVDGLRLIVCACCSWHMALKFGLDVSSDNL